MSTSQNKNIKRYSCDDFNKSTSNTLEDLEKKYPPLKFYFKQEIVDATRINCPASGNTMEELLKKMFEGSGLFFNSYEGVYFLIHDQPNLKSLFKPKRVSNKTGVMVGVVYRPDSLIPLESASVYHEETGLGTITNSKGEFTLELPYGEHLLNITSVGFNNQTQLISIPEDKKVKIVMSAGSIELREFEIFDVRQNEEVVSHSIGMEKVGIKEVEELPRLLGEPEVIQSILLMPGVTNVGEGASGFNVRGGNVDQNLILFDDCLIFNPSHLYGFLSIFNPDVVKNVSLHKGGISSEYGGRVSSVLDISSKDGDLKLFHGLLSPGVVNSRFALEGPIVKDKVSFLLATRLAYPNWIFKAIKNNDVIGQRASFYDGNFKLVYWPNKKNKISLFGYGSDDKIKLSEFSTNEWNTMLGGVSWKSYISDKYSLKTSLNATNYGSEIIDNVSDFEISLSSEVMVYSFKSSLEFNPGEKHQFRCGLGVNYYDIDPRNVLSSNSQDFSESKKFALAKEFSAETNIFFGHRLNVSDRLLMDYGFRVSPYLALGESMVFEYNKDVPKSIASIKDSFFVSKNEVIKSFVDWEPRITLRYLLTENTSLKIGYNKMIQHLHLISNTASPQPFSIWKSSNFNVDPIKSHQISIGLYNNINSGKYKLSGEIYYKQLNNILEYKNGANLIYNPYLEVDLIPGKGKAYGLEVKLDKSKGRLKGGVGYTFSRSWMKFNGKHKEETINNGEFYPTNYDKPHDLTISGHYSFTRVISMTFQFLYATGRPFTGPTSKYVIGDDDIPIEIPHYSKRNEYRLPHYHRMDVSFNFKRGHRIKQHAYTQWSFSVYNLYGRKNAYSIFFVDKKDALNSPFKAYKLSIIGVPVLSISCQIKF